MIARSPAPASRLLSRTLGLILLSILSSCDGGETTGPETGSVVVRTSTTGADLDPDGYTVALDASSTRQIPPNGSTTFTDIPSGEHSLELTGLAANCSVAGANPRALSLGAGATATERFDVACDRLTGDLEVSASTTGEDLDPDGYTVTLDGSTSRDLGIDGSVTFERVSVGEHQVELSGLASNCAVAGENPRAVTVSGQAGSTTFQVSCWASLQGRIVFSSDRDGNPDVYVMNTDGSRQVRLTSDPLADFQPAAAPDGNTIAFVSTRDTDGASGDIFVMNPDGTGLRNLTADHAGNCFAPDWAPTGSTIAFTCIRGGNRDIWIMPADGSVKTRLTEDASIEQVPRWSPDGTKIAFETDRDGDFEIYLMDNDGSNPVNLTNDPEKDFSPAWSPDGTKLAFGSDRIGGRGEIFVVDVADPSMITNLTNTAESEFNPDWSPDGTRIGFTSDRDGDYEIYVMNATDGTDQTNLSRAPAGDDDFARWGPR